MPADHELKEARHRQLLALVRRVRVTSQEQLAALLRERSIEATQSLVSRDLTELGVTKVGGRYVAPERPEGAAAPREIDEITRHLRAIRPAGPHLTVLLTVIGTAQTVALAMDRLGWPEVTGTLGGDDTVFVATAGAAEQKLLIRRLEGILRQARKEGSDV